MPTLSSAMLSIVMLSSGVISVNLVGQNAAMLHWKSPTHRQNGEILTSKMIDGYTIRYGVDDNIKTITINDPLTHHIKIYDLQNGKNVFLIAAFDTKGMHGQFSEPVYKTIGRERGDSRRVP